MMNSAIKHILAAAILTAGIGTSNAVAGSKSALRLSGSTTVAPLMLEVGKRYEVAHASTRINVESGGSSRGIADLRKGLSDIAMVSRDLKPTESNLVTHAIARDGVALILHRDNPVSGVEIEQLKRIFSGSVENWSEVNGPAMELVVVSKSEGHATSTVFNGFLGLTAADIDADVIVGANAQMIKTVAANKGAIGYVSIGAASVDISLGTPLKLISLGKVEATMENVANGTYFPTRTLSLVTRPDVVAGAQPFIDYAQSEAVHDLIIELSYAPVEK